MVLQTRVSARPQEAAWLGFWGVDCFFVLTGFLLCGPYLRAIVDGASLPDWRRFATRRALRIYPLYLACLALSVVDESLHAQRPSLLDVGAHLLMLHGFFVPYITQINGPLWTMAVDAQFYVLMPIVLYAFNSAVRAKPQDVRVRYVWLLLATICCLSALERFTSLYVLAKTGAATWDSVTVYSRNVIGMGTNFAIGAALAFLAIRRPKPRGPKAWYAAAAILGASLVVLQWKTLGFDATHGMAMVRGYGSIDILGGCSAGLLLYGLTRGGFSNFEAVVRGRFVATLAALAYAVYLFQEPIINHVMALYRGPLGDPFVALALAAVSLLVVYCAAIPLHRFVEQPFLSMRESHRDAIPTLP
jgi:peptidoglycan/LPS O-acetylase OafA/YrhL